MLDAISDFWKPMKKNQSQPEKLKPEQLQEGSTLGFGFVPQVNLSGRRLTVSGMNTYQFGDESLTSFVLTQDKEAGVSMIIAESEGEQYLALSRRIAISDRMKMFDSRDLENIIEKADITHLPCKDAPSEYKGWTVASYKREIQNLKGRIYKGDFRKNPLPDAKQAQEFQYTLLVSDSNEHAIEIEKYGDGRVEVYATVYRRISDIGEVTHPSRVELNRPDLKIASKESPPVVTASEPKLVVENPKSAAAVETPKAAEPAKPEPIKLQELPKADVVETKAAKPEAAPKPKQEEKPRMQATETAANGAAKDTHMVKPVEMSAKQEVKAVSKMTNGMDNEAVECDLRVANKIIDEAIRNEMRLSDVVRRIIELPVAHQEAVHIPVTLSDEDYQLLAIRYSMAASDRNAIKKRIIDDLNNFSGNGVAKKAA